MKIDMHSHFFPPIAEGEATRYGSQNLPWLRIGPDGAHGDIMVDGRSFRPVEHSLWEPEARVAMLDGQGIDLQLVCATPVMFGYDLNESAAEDWCARMNEAARAFCRPAPDRLASLAQIALQHPALAMKQITEAKAAGHRGVQIGNHIGDVDLYHPDMLAVLSHCAAADMPVLVHPWDLPRTERQRSWMLQWLVGMPSETQLTILSLILSGGFERLPASLRICFAHGGGSFAFQLGRAENAWHNRDVVRADCPRPPSAYVDRIHVDSALFDPAALRMAAEILGPDRIMLGSDQPFPLGEQQVGALVERSFASDPAIREAMLWRNAARFFDIGTAGEA